MNLTEALINLFALACLAVALSRDRRRALEALKEGFKVFIAVLPTMVAVALAVGLLTGFTTPEQISSFIGEEAGVLGVIYADLIGAILHIPALVAFPLAAGLLERGASVGAVAAFITSLTMIGVVTLPLEARMMGRRFTVIRNLAGLGAAVAVALLVEAVL